MAVSSQWTPKQYGHFDWSRERERALIIWHWAGLLRGWTRISSAAWSRVLYSEHWETSSDPCYLSNVGTTYNQKQCTSIINIHNFQNCHFDLTADDTNQHWLSTTSYIENIRMLSLYVSHNLVFFQARSELLMLACTLDIKLGCDCCRNMHQIKSWSLVYLIFLQSKEITLKNSSNLIVFKCNFHFF